MKKSKTQTAATRKRILEVAGHTFKSNGIEATGVAEIMTLVGMTHGGFYRHFESKEQLVLEACARSIDLQVQQVAAASLEGRDSFLKLLRTYLSTRYRDDLTGGCPLAAMGSELVRADEPTRRAASRGIHQVIEIFSEWAPREKGESVRDGAYFMLSAMVGALTMARIVDEPAVSERILKAARRRLMGGIGGASRKKGRAVSGRSRHRPAGLLAVGPPSVSAVPVDEKGSRG